MNHEGEGLETAFQLGVAAHTNSLNGDNPWRLASLFQTSKQEPVVDVEHIFWPKAQEIIRMSLKTIAAYRLTHDPDARRAYTGARESFQ